MKELQAALDLLSTEDAKEMLKKIEDYVDITELGTPLMISEGADVTREVKPLYPEKTVFAGIKIVDGGFIMADIAFQTRADMAPVLAQANDATIQDVIKTAKEYHGKILVDMCAVKDTEARVKQTRPRGPDYICVYVGYDVQNAGADPAEEVKKLLAVKCEKATAGGIRMVTSGVACQSNIGNIIVDDDLFNVPDPAVTAKQVYEILNKYR